MSKLEGDDLRLYQLCLKAGRHTYFALEPDFEELGGVKHVFLACTACGYLLHHELALKKHANQL